MSPAYLWRIVARLPDQEPVEVYRSNVRYAQKVWDFYTRDMSQAWTVWMEQTLGERACLTPRIKINSPTVHRRAEEARLYA